MYYVHNDQLGGSNVITNSSGALEELTDYYPYGSIRLDEKNSGFNEQKKFTGQIFDQDTGYNYMNARYQDPTTGRFISIDQLFQDIGSIDTKKQNLILADPQRLNSYSYSRNNPLIYVDQDGKTFSLGAFMTSPFVGLAQAGGDRYGNYLLNNPHEAARVTPGISEYIATTELITGKDYFTGSTLNNTSKAIGFAGLALSIVPGGSETKGTYTTAREIMLKGVENGSVKNLISDIWRTTKVGADKIGDGSSFSAAIDEAQTGILISGKNHYGQKLNDIISRVNNIYNKLGDTLSQSDLNKLEYISNRAQDTLKTVNKLLNKK